MSERQKIVFALLLSVLLHIAGCALLAGWTWLHPDFLSKALAQTNEQLEVTLMPNAAPTPPALTLAANPEPEPEEKKMTRSTLDTEGLTESETPPENAMFESDKNSRAGSELPATGNAPLPTQEGKKRTFTQFENQDYTLGKGKAPAPTMEVAKASAPLATPAPAPAPAVTPEPSPTGITKVEPAVSPPFKNMPPEEAPSAQPTPFFNPTPVPAESAEPTATPKDAIALGKPTPTPAAISALATPSASPENSEPPKPTPVPVASATPAPLASATPQELAKLSAPTPSLRARAPSQSDEPGYQPQREKTKIDGGITRPGKPGVDAVATPLGRYKKSIGDAVGSSWYHRINPKMDLITVGDVHIKFYVTENGKVEDVKILSNTANATFGNLCIDAVTSAKIPSMPPEVAPALVDGRLEIDYHFTIYPQ